MAETKCVAKPFAERVVADVIRADAEKVDLDVAGKVAREAQLQREVVADGGTVDMIHTVRTSLTAQAILGIMTVGLTLLAPGNPAAEQISGCGVRTRATK